MYIVSGIITESKGFPPQHGYVLKLQGIVSFLAGHTSLSPKGGWSLNSECKCSCYCSVASVSAREPPARHRGIRRELYPAPHSKARNRICEGPEFYGGKRNL